MNKLAIYVAGILGYAGAPVIVEKKPVASESWLDQGYRVTRSTTGYRFADGAEIRRIVEQDDFPGDAACAECWITYEVAATAADGLPILPARQTFSNICRESFWLAYQLA